MKKLHSSNRGLTFSITPNEQYYPGGHYIYEVRPTCIIIRPSKSGLKISKKRSGANINALFDLRSKKVRDAVSRCSHMEMEVLQDKIIVRCIRSIKDKIVPIERVLAEFSVSKVVLKAAAGIEGQISIAEYLDSIGFSDWNTTVNEEVRSVFSVMSLFSGAGMLDWPFHLDPAFEINYACDSDAAACESYRHNIGNHIVCRDVREVSGKIPPQHLIIGGPSCKPFSSSNRRRRMENHEDVDLVDEYIRITQENCPEIFVIENVPQFITCESGKFLSKVLQKLIHRYTITSNIVRDCDIGGYTTRKRAIIIGSRIGKIQLPQLKLYPFHTVREALSKVTSKWYNYFDVTTSRPETEKRMALVRPGHNHNYHKEDIHYWYHGSRNMNCLSILHNGLILNPKAPKVGHMFGYGIYLAPKAKKSIGYTSLNGSFWVHGTSDKAYLFVMKTVYKSPYHVYTWTSGMKSLTKSRISPHDAVFAHAGTSLRNDEVVIFDDAQVTLQYIIELKQQ